MKNKVFFKIKSYFKQPVFKVVTGISILVIVLFLISFLLPSRNTIDLSQLIKNNSEYSAKTSSGGTIGEEIPSEADKNIAEELFIPPGINFTDPNELEQILVDPIRYASLRAICCNQLTKNDAYQFLKQKLVDQKFKVVMENDSKLIDDILFAINEISGGSFANKHYVILLSNYEIVVLGLNAEIKIERILHNDDLLAFSQRHLDLPKDFFKVNNWGGSVVWDIPEGYDYASLSLEVDISQVNPEKCNLTHTFEPDRENDIGFTENLKPLSSQIIKARDGKHIFKISCEFGEHTLSSTIKNQIVDRQPEKCKDFNFVESEITVNSLEELHDSIVGTWQGCFSSPWTVDTLVKFKFKEDGSVYIENLEELDGYHGNPLYNGDGHYSNTIFIFKDFTASKMGMGYIEYENNVFSDFKIMGNKLFFEYRYNEIYGPLSYKLYKVPE